MSDDATLRALAARATPGPWAPDGDKIRATAADALLPQNILVACYTGHDHRLGLKTISRCPSAPGGPLRERASVRPRARDGGHAGRGRSAPRTS